jgi:aminocarboxymuconate-semialdehyde decarboxylase
VVGGWTDVYGYELPGEEGADWARFFNEHLQKDADAVGRLTDTTIAVGQVVL